MYVDEVGNPGLKATLQPNDRYLSLTGVVISLDHERDVVHPMIEDLKNRYFGSHPDQPVVFHRKELVNRKWPFQALRDPRVEEAFNAELLSLVRDLEYVVITAVIDKFAHLAQYHQWAKDPYHYCLSVLMERYVMWLGPG